MKERCPAQLVIVDRVVKVYFAECGLQNAEFRKDVFCGISPAENLCRIKCILWN